MKFDKRNLAVKYIILSVLVLAWGSSFILMKEGLKVFTSGEVAGIRISAAFLFLLPLGFRHFKNIPANKWKYIALSGFIGYFIPAFLFTKAETELDSSIAGILNSTTPLFTLIIGFAFYKLKSYWLNISGVFVGLIGAIGLMYINGKGNISINFSYGALVMFATLLYALNINIIKTNLKNVHSTSLTVFLYLIIGPFALVYLFGYTDFVIHLTASPIGIEKFGYVLILGIVCSALATIIYNYLIKITGVLFAASVTYLMPIVAIMWGILAGEKFKSIYFLFILLILSGVYMVNYRYSKNKF